MTTAERPAPATWPTSLAAGVVLAWFTVLALAMWLGSNGPRPIAAWFVAYPMFALYPGVAALASTRVSSPGAVTAIATVVPVAALLATFLPDAVELTPRGLRDDRWEFGFMALILGLGLVVAIRVGARLMRGGHPILGFVGAGAVFILAATFASFPLILLV